MLRDGARVVIVGASLAGLTTAEALRAEGFAGDIVLIGAEPEGPYSRPPLSKQVLSGAWAAEQALIRSGEELRAARIRTRLGEPAVDLDRWNHEVVLGDGDRIPFDALVIATGVATRRVVEVGGAPVLALRTLDDARLLRTRLESAQQAVILGAGVLGSEIVSAARAAGVDATLVGRSRELGLGSVGRLLSDRLVDLHRGAGVRLELGATVTGVHADRVALDTGAEVRGDLVVATIGGDPQTAWLRGSGLDVVDGVLCDADGRAAPDVYAVGDVARWTDPLTGLARRVEHQANAIEQALAVGRTLATGESRPAAPPFFWSEIHGVRIQAYGSFEPHTPLTPFGEPLDDGRALLASVDDAGAVTGIVGWNAARAFRLARAEVDRTLDAARITREVVA